jgi:DNA-directed RNA polymerase subunit RPC12/RpoP
MIPLIQNPTNGQWYLSARCQACGFRMLVFCDLNDGKGTVEGSYLVTCPRCNKRQSLPAEHYQHRDRKLKPEIAS